MEEIFEEYIEDQQNEEQHIHEDEEEEAVENVIESNQSNFENITENEINEITLRTNLLLKQQIDDLLTLEITNRISNNAIKDEEAVQIEYINFLLIKQQELQNYLDQLKNRLLVDFQEMKPSECNVIKLQEMTETIDQHVQMWTSLFESLSREYNVIVENSQKNEKDLTNLLIGVDDATGRLLNEFEMKKSEIRLEKAISSVPSSNNDRHTKLKELISSHKNIIVSLSERMQKLNKINEMERTRLTEIIQETQNYLKLQMDKNKKVTNEMRDVQDKLQQVIKEKSFLEDSKNQLEYSNNSKEDEILNLKHSYSKITQEIDSLQIELTRIENDIVDFNDKNDLKEIDEELKSIENERSFLNTENQNLKLKLTEKEEIYFTKQNSNDETKKLLSNTEIAFKNLQLTLKNMDQDYYNRTETLKEHEKIFNHLSVEELPSLNKKYQESQGELESKISVKRLELIKKKDKGAVDLNVLKDLLNTQEEKFTQLQTEYTNKSEELKSIQTNIVNLNSEIDSLRTIFKLRVKYLDKIKEEVINSGKFKIRKYPNPPENSSVSPDSKRVRFNDVVEMKSATET